MKTAMEIARLRRKHPGMSQTDVAARLGVSVRTARRHWATTEPTANEPGTTTEPAESADESELAA